MKHTIFIVLIVLQYLTIHAQSKDITIGTIEILHSKILDEDRKIWIHIPKDEVDYEGVDLKYPVLYLLDGNGHFSSVVGMIERLSSKYSDRAIPKMIVVGIENTDRTRDLTPTKGNSAHPYVSESLAEQSGGGENFLKFIKEELMPYIESNSPANSYKMFVGHSFGGLTVMHAFRHHTSFFNSYIAIDPSMSWSDGVLLSDIKSNSSREFMENTALYLGIANTIPKEMELNQVLNDTTVGTEHIKRAFELDAYLRNQQIETFNYKGYYYENDTHGTVPTVTIYDGLRFIFKEYQYWWNNEDFDEKKEKLISKIQTHYTQLSQKMNYEVKPDISLINSIGKEFLTLKEYNLAFKFLQLNKENYPESYRVYDALGDFYSAKGEKEKAIDFYKESLVINKNSESKIKLQKLLDK